MNVSRVDKRKIIFLSSILIITFLADVISKQLAVMFLQKENLTLINNFLHLTYCENDAGTFGMLQGLEYNLRITLIVCLSLIIILTALFFIIKTWDFNKVRNLFPLVLMMSAALGNGTDLVVRGYVVDFIQICNYNRTLVICNFADIYATFGWLLFLILYPIYPNIVYMRRKKH